MHSEQPKRNGSGSTSSNEFQNVSFLNYLLNYNVMLKLKPGKFILHSPCLLSYTFTSKASKICTLMIKIQSLSKKGKGADCRLKGQPTAPYTKQRGAARWLCTMGGCVLPGAMELRSGNTSQGFECPFPLQLAFSSPR